VAEDDGEVEGLGIDIEVVLAEADDAGAAGEQFLAVFELTDGLLLGALEAALEVVGLDGVVEGQQLPDGIADLGDHAGPRPCRRGFPRAKRRWRGGSG
jgi:hypothetical protein